MTNERNARFWVLWNGQHTKITLRPNQALTMHQSAPTDEGWSSETQTYRLEDGTVYCELTSDGRDCDGRLSSAADFLCPVGDLRLQTRTQLIGDYIDGAEQISVPVWDKEGSRQRDYSAEACGY
jgi:hypothetical protein